MEVSGIRVVRSLVFCIMFCRSLFVLFLFAIVLSSPSIYGFCSDFNFS